MPTTESGSGGRMSRDLDDEQTERLREIVRKWSEETSQTAVAEAVGVSPSTISSLLGRRQGGSYAMAFAAAQHRQIPLSEILGVEATRRILELEPEEQGPIDPKREVQRSAVYRDAHEWVRLAFDHDDRYTSSAVANKVTAETYMRRLLQIVDEHRQGVLQDPTQLKPGARLLPPPEDPDRPKKKR